MEESKLETYRREDLAKTSFYNPSTGQMLEFTAHERAIQSFYLSLQSLEQLENANYAFPLGTTSALSVGSWFLSVESMINGVLKLASLSFKTVNFESLKGHTLGSRFGKVIEILEIDKQAVGETGLHAELHEFGTLRNEMFHDRTFENPLSFHKTLFSPSATELNQVDVIQSFKIFLKLAQVLRYSVAGLDLMPSIIINRNDIVFHSKLDRLYTHLIEIAFSDVLKKHRLKTDLELVAYKDARNWIVKPINGWNMCIKHQSKFAGHSPNGQKTTILDDAWFEWIKTESAHVNQETFGIPDYTDRRKP